MKHYHRFFLAIILTWLPCSIQAQSCFDCGNGMDGDLHISSDTILTSGTFQFNDFSIDSGVQVQITGHQPLFIKCKGKVEIEGVLDLSGGNALPISSNLTSPVAGKSVAGGSDGANSVYASNQPVSGLNGNGMGFGHGFANGGGSGASYGELGTSCGLLFGQTYGDKILTQFYGGSGGGSGSAESFEHSGAGGGGGGILVLQSCTSILIGPSGKIISNGGNGSAGSSNAAAGGGGSGGMIYLQSNLILIEGIVSAVGGMGGISTNSASCFNGGNGGEGRIRIDSQNLTLSGTALPTPYLKTLFNAGVRRVVPVKCYGTSTGYAKAKASGGKHPYTFNWSNGATTDELLGVAAGTYTVTISDAYGCSLTDVAIIPEPTPLEVEVLSTSPSCRNTLDGQAIFSTTGGTPYPYNKSLFTTLYSNEKSNGVMFDFSCNTKISLTSVGISLPSTQMQTISIYLKSGSMTGATTDSTKWKLIKTVQLNGAGAEEETKIDISTLPALAAGLYSLYIYNNQEMINSISSTTIGNAFNFDHVLTVYEGISRDFNTDLFKAGTTGIVNLAGRISYTVKNDLGYSYISNNPDSSSYMNQLSSGPHEISVSDALGCVTQKAFTISESANIEVDHIMVRSPRCSNTNDGEIEIQATPAISEYLSLSGSPFVNPSNGSMLHFTTSRKIQLKGFELFLNKSGQASVYLKPGNYIGHETNASTWTSLGNYSLSKSTNSNTTLLLLNNPFILNAGDWSIYIASSDDLLNQLDSVSFYDNHALNYLNSIARTGSSGLFNTNEKIGSYWAGNIRYAEESNTLSYSWNSFGNGSHLLNLPGGNYACTIEQNNGCSITENFMLASPAPISAAASTYPELDYNQNGAVILHPSGGLAPYYIQWINQGVTGNQLLNQTEGSQPFFIADANGCTLNDTAYIPRMKSPFKSEGELQIGPNPGKGFIHITKEITGMEICTLSIFDFTGRLITQQTTSVSALMYEGLNLSSYSDGNYFITVSDEDQFFRTKANITR